MFARKVSMHLKPDGVAEFTRKLEKDVIPLLRKQNGFQDEITFVATDRKEAFESVCGTGRRARKLTTVDPTQKSRRSWRR